MGNAPDKSVHIDEETFRGEVPTLYGDETRLKQILLNLVKNAYKFTTEGRVEVRMSYDMIRGVLVGQVKDTGRGIRRDDTAKLFSRYS